MRKSILFFSLSTVFAASACSSKKEPVKKKQRAFPESSTRADSPIRTAIQPTSLPEPSITPAEPAAEPVVPEPSSFREYYAAGKQAIDSEPERAKEYLQKALELNDAHINAAIQLARVNIVLSEFGEARVAIEKVIENEPENSFAWNTLGRIELAEDDIEGAARSFEEATEHNETNGYAWNNLGYTLIRLQRFEEAASALENATTVGRPADYMWNNLGMAYEHLDRLDEARAAYRQASELGSSKATDSLERLEGVDTVFPVEAAGVPTEEEVEEIE